MPEYGRPVTVHPVHRSAVPVSLRRLKTSCGAPPLAAVLPFLDATLVAIADEAMHKMVVTDALGHVLWRAPGRRVWIHHSWTCAACPIRDPGSGAMIGVVDVCRPARRFHPTTLALVASAARLAEGHLATRLAVREMVAVLPVGF